MKTLAIFRLWQPWLTTGTKISSITTHEGILLMDHEQKAGLLWESFKDRLGISEYVGISYNLISFLQSHQLEFLSEDFDESEIDAVISSLPRNHIPGPDGFNGLFIRKCRPIIKQDFLRLFKYFSNNSIDLSGINSSLIALILKRNNPESVDDFGTISLLNYSLKSITKLLSIRLQSVIPQLIHTNQYGFLKGRTIQDCLAWAFQFLHLCHHSKKGIVILKLDFEKSFNKIEHQSILEVLRNKGFLGK